MLKPPRIPLSVASLVGIDSASIQSKAGEVALAHHGILFFDEFTNFSKSVLESLREPLEDHRILVSRVNAKIVYETKFLFAAAQNPCPCGNLLSQSLECRCSQLELSRYKNRISEPILDRIDLHIQMSEEHTNELSMSSEQMQEKVLKAFFLQKKRGQSELNGKLSEHDTHTFCTLSNEAQESLSMAQMRLGLTQRSSDKILRISRTIADLEECDIISNKHLLEALSFRKR